MYKFSVNDPDFLPHCGCQFELRLEKGDFITLVGENGVGKSTLARRFFQQSSFQISYIQQGPMDLFYDRSLRRIREIFLSSRRGEISENKFLQMWEQFHFSKKETRLQSELSGGEGQALKLCLGLSIERDIYLLDEPSQFLDQSLREKLQDTLSSFLAEGKTVIMIEHDLSWAKFSMKISELNIQDNILKEKKSWNT